MASTHAPHVVFCATPAWSHWRGLCVFAARLAAENAITATLLVSHFESLSTKVSAEAARCFSEFASPKGTLRVIAFGQHQRLKDMSDLGKVDVTSFDVAWQVLVGNRVLTCDATGTEYPSAGEPTLLIFEAFTYPLLPSIRAALPSVPILAWVSSSAAGLIALSLPGQEGGWQIDQFPEFTPAERAAGGRDLGVSGKVLNIPGLPAMYDWEHFPQAFPMAGRLMEIQRLYTLAVSEYDGLVTPWAEAHDGEVTISAITKWVSASGRSTYCVGPTMPFRDGTTELSIAAQEADKAATPPNVADKIDVFLNESLKKAGEHSVVYVGFGNFFAGNADHLWTLLEMLAQRGIPFILSHCSPLAQIPEHIQRLDNEKKGLLVPWAPQQSLLSHKAVGWFVTHGGAGGTMDAATQGVPIIGWPFIGDQPVNIAYLADTADVAFELVEVHSGDFGLKPRHRDGRAPVGSLDAFRKEVAQLLDDMKGQVGARKRANAKQMQAELAKAWAAGGTARRDCDALVAKFNL